MSKPISINDIKENMIILINMSSSSERLYFAKVIEVTTNGLLRVRAFRNLEIESIVIDQSCNIFKRIRVCDKEETSKHFSRQEAKFKSPMVSAIQNRKKIQNKIDQLKKDYEIQRGRLLDELKRITEKTELESRILKRNMEYLQLLKNI